MTQREKKFWTTIATIIAAVISGGGGTYLYSHSEILARHDEKIVALQENQKKIDVIQRDISDMRERMAGIEAGMNQLLGNNGRKK